MLEALSSVASTVRGPSSVSTVTSSSTTTAANSVPGGDFANVLAEVGNTAVDTMKAGESTAIGGLQGKASVQNVVEAVLAAEQTLQTALAVRDKVVAAYQELSRMPI